MTDGGRMAGAERAARQEQEEAREAAAGPAPASVPWSGGAADRVIALQQSAGNAAVARILARQGPHGATATPPVQAPDPTQAAGSHASLINDPAVERQSETSLRGAARGAMGMAYSDFTNACQDVKAQRAAASAQPSFVEQLASIMIGALAPGMAGVVLSVVRSRLMEVAEGVITVAIRERSVALLPGQSAGQARTDVTAAARELVDKWITLDGAQAQAGVRAFAQSQAPPAGAAPPAGGAPIPVPELIDQFERNYRQQILQAQLQIESLSRAQALGVFAAYARADRHFYMAQINSLVSQHEELARAADDPGTRPFGGIDTRKIVMFEAHGVRRPAILEYDVGAFMVRRSHWKFTKWVSDEMVDTATAVGNAQRVGTVGGGSRVAGMEVVQAGVPYPMIPVQGHIPVPGVEGERVVRTDAYGHPRLAYAYIQGTGARFVRWVPQNEVSFAQVQGERQQGGINVIGPSQWQGSLPAPSGADDAQAP
jgi:hypothetical protein